MKIRPSVKPMCEKCRIIKRKGRVRLFVKIPNINRNRADNLLWACGGEPQRAELINPSTILGGAYS